MLFIRRRTLDIRIYHLVVQLVNRRLGKVHGIFTVGDLSFILEFLFRVSESLRLDAFKATRLCDGQRFAEYFFMR